MATIGYKGENLDLLIRQGASFDEQVIFAFNNQPVDLTGLSFRGQVRKTFDAPLITAQIQVDVVDAINGVVRIYIPDDTTALIEAGETEDDPLSQYVYDIEAEDANTDVYPFLYGIVSVFREVTK